MPLIKNLVPWAGLNFSAVPGDVIDVPKNVAKARIAAGLAEAHNPKSQPAKTLEQPVTGEPLQPEAAAPALPLAEPGSPEVQPENTPSE